MSGRATGNLPKQIVAAGYDEGGFRYSAARAEATSPALASLLEVLPAGATVLDIGCGAGVPVTAALARVADVVGVDISPVQLEQARRNVPQARFILGDIMATEFSPQSFDAVVAFYALFHVPREEHRALLERISTWLRPAGHFLATLAGTSHPGYTEPDFFGATMYWSYFAADWYLDVLRALGFDVLAAGVVGHGYRPAPGLPPEQHPYVFARLGAAPESGEGERVQRRR
jgi:cyclopropane fatty-acyl-phospholipid synthase-like methyltransferase